jgi:putative transposase
LTLAAAICIVDDTVASKPFATNIDLARHQYSGREHRQVNGIDVVNLLWTTGAEYIPVDYRVYAPMHDGKGKNEHFREMLDKAAKRQFSPSYVLLDSWYSGLKNLKAIRHKGWQWMTNLKSNRLVSVARGTSLPVSGLDLGDGTVKHVWLNGYGEVVVAKLVIKHNEVRYLASSDTSLSGYEELVHHWQQRWNVEEFHEGLKQTTGVGNCSAQRAHAQREHIFAVWWRF